MISPESILRHPDLHRFSHRAMATVFEIFMLHEDRSYSQQAAAEAFRLAESLEFDLSRFNPNGDIGRINSLGAGPSARIGIHALTCLKRAVDLQIETKGCFDIFIGSMKDGWHEGKSSRAGGKKRCKSGEFSGPIPLQFDEESHEARLSERVTIDLGAFGKGFAVDRMADLLREWDIASALVHGGQSSVYSFGRLHDGTGWPVTISRPLPSGGRKVLHRFELRDRAMGASGLEKGPHIFDPRTGEPVCGRTAVWVLAPDAATADALSTAFMVMEPDAVAAYCSSHPGIQAAVLPEDVGKGISLSYFGIPDEKAEEKP
jgi:FAD:protein FMN transferase